jgi:predicted nucleic acid-binding protein
MTFGTPEPLVIADASPLIGLAKIGRLGILHRLAREVWIPRAVWLEVTAGASGRAEAGDLLSHLAGSVRDVDLVLTRKFIRQVDPGEAAAVALAITSPGCLLLIDDAAGRRVAEAEGIRCIGAAGLLLRAKRTGLIPSLAADLSALRMHGYFLSERLVVQLLAAAGERVIE